MSMYDTAQALRDDALRRSRENPQQPLLPRQFCIKVVPNIEPNADGVWQLVTAETVERRNSPPRELWNFLLRFVGPQEHVVGYTPDLRYAGKPGNWTS